MKISTIFLSLAAGGLAVLSGCVGGPGMAVTRGQAAINPSALPLVCITLALENAELPMTTLRVKDLDTNEFAGFDVSAWDLNHPKVLAEMQGPHRSLSMLIVHLKPGRYQADGAGFNGHGGAEFFFDFASRNHFTFLVRPDCINYVGTIDLSANWWAIDMNNRYGGTFGLFIRVQDTTQHDREWAVREVPGLATVPSVDSPISDEQTGDATASPTKR